jgi:hypothetical protein
MTADSYTTRNRLIKQGTGNNSNLWGDLQSSQDFDLTDFALDGWSTVALTGAYSLTTANGSTDEARSRMLKFTGTGSFTVTIPSVSKWYLIWNACTSDLTITTGAGATVTLGTGDKRVVFTDGSVVYEPGWGGTDPKTYVDTLAWTYNAGALPAQAGNAGKYVTTNGATASWGNPFASPSFTGGATLTGGLTFDGAVKGNVVAVGATTLDVSAGEYQTKAISGDTTFSLTGTTSGRSAGFILELTTSSSAQPTFTGARWKNGTKPPLANGTHLIGLVYSGSAWTAVLISTAIA